MSDDDERSDAEQVLAELDPKRAHEALGVSRRQTLRALASVGALTSVGSASGQSAGTVVADEAYFSNYGWEPDGSGGGTLTIDGDAYTFDGSETIGLPDGGVGGELVTPSGATASELIGPSGQVLWEGDAIRDSVVSRPNDGNTTGFDSTDEAGVIISSSDTLESIGCRLSANVSNQETADIIRFSDSTVLDSVDISGLSAGDVFTFDQVNLSADTEYAIAVSASSSWTSGFITLIGEYPYTSDDGVLSITNGYFNDGSTNASHNIVEVGNLGFD